MNDVVKGEFGSPAKNALGSRRISENNRRVTNPPFDHLVWDLVTGLIRGADKYVEDRRSDTRAKVQGGACAASGQVVKGSDVGTGKILHMDIVSNAGAIRRGVVVPKHLHRADLNHH